MTRQEANKLIIDKIISYLEKNKDARFLQALINLGLTDSVRDEKYDMVRYYDILNFYEESIQTLKRLEGNISCE